MRATLLVITGLAVLGGCGEKPQAAYDRLVFNARMGNEKAFLKGFTKDSARLVRTLLALRRTYGSEVNANADPYMSLVLEEVDSVEIEEREIKVRNDDGELESAKRNVAILTVTDGKIYRKIRMLELDDGWKIDALDLQKLWAEDRGNFVTR